MHPNPQDALALPPRPDAEQFKKRAKGLARACRSENPAELTDAVRAWIDSLIAVWPTAQHPSAKGIERAVEQITAFARHELGQDCSLTKAQFVIARAHGFP